MGCEHDEAEHSPKYVGEANAGKRDNSARFTPVILPLANERCNMEIFLENDLEYEDVEHQFDLLDGNAN